MLKFSMRLKFQFFNKRFGLNFTLSEPDELGQRFFQNATLQPYSRHPLPGFVAFNRWLVTGNTRSKCYTLSVGGYAVRLTGEQTLKGTYMVDKKELRWHGSHSAKVNENINLGYSHDQRYS